MWQTSTSIYIQSPQSNWIFSLGWLLNQFECETRKVTTPRGLSPRWSIAVQITCFSRHSVGSHATCDTVFPTCRCLYAHKICAGRCLCILMCKFKTNTSHWYVKDIGGVVLCLLFSRMQISSSVSFLSGCYWTVRRWKEGGWRVGFGEKSLNSCFSCRSSSAVDQGSSLPSINKQGATVGGTNPGKSTWDCIYVWTGCRRLLQRAKEHIITSKNTENWVVTFWFICLCRENIANTNHITWLWFYDDSN